MRLGQSGGRCYDHIRLLIESPRKASPEQQCQLVDDALRLSLNYQRLYVTLLINDDAEAVVHRWNANHPAHTQVLPLLDWTPAELQRLLWLRLRPSEYPQDSAPPHDPLLNLRVPLSKSAKEQSLSIIAEHAVRAKKDGEAASVHALRLARLLLTECAQRWANSETARPLGPGDLSSLCNRYWEERAQMEKEERYA